ncbi:Protein spt10 [Coniothyrium glycines]
MAEVIGIIASLYTAGQALHLIAHETHKWRDLSNRLFDLVEGIDVAEATLESWKRKYDVQARRPRSYMRTLFGKHGSERIQATLGSIKIINGNIRNEIDRTIGNALKVRSSKFTSDDIDDKELVRDCLRRIQQNTLWSQKFRYSVFRKADHLEADILRLHNKLSALERFSDSFSEREHPEYFSGFVRLPGRKVIYRVGDGRLDRVQKKVLDALAARKDADLLHRASGSAKRENRVHIGLSVTQIHRRDFAFLLDVNGKTHEVLAQPVTIKSYSDPARVQPDFAHAVPALVNKVYDTCYMLPSASSLEGFEIKSPPTNLLTDLEYKDPLSNIIRNEGNYLGSQLLYHQDQSAIASGIAQGSFRLIGSQWMDFLDCANVRWRRTKDGKWTSMLTAAPGSGAISRTLDQCLKSNLDDRGRRNLSRHIHVFRVGLVLTELALKQPVSYIAFDRTTNTVKLYMDDGDELDALQVAAQIDLKANVFLGNMVLFCLSALQDQDVMSDKNIETAYFKYVVKEAEKLEALFGQTRPKVSPAGSGFNTPRTPNSGFAL